MNKTAFTFDDVRVAPDRQIGLHSHPQWELSMVICGAGTRTIGSLTQPMKEGEVVLIPPNIPHVWQFDPSHTDSDGNIANITIFFETVTLDGISVVFPELKSCVERLRSLSEAINIKDETQHRVTCLLKAMRGMSSEARVSKMIELLHLMTEADFSESVGRNNIIGRLEQRLEKVRTFCNCNYGRNISLDEIAAHVNMNKSAFCTFMRRYTGLSLSEYVNKIRLQRAMEMLRQTDKRISDIAFDTGFSNASYFNRLFRNKYHCTPKSMRQNSNNNEVK